MTGPGDPAHDQYQAGQPAVPAQQQRTADLETAPDPGTGEQHQPASPIPDQQAADPLPWQPYQPAAQQQPAADPVASQQHQADPAAGQQYQAAGQQYQAADPFPGQQYPAAVLPGSEPFPSGPMPMVTFPASEPFAAQPQAPTYQPTPPKPRNKLVIGLTVAVVFLFLAAGALGTLWLVEQGNHKGTSSELETVKNNLAKTTDQLKTAQDEATKSNVDRQRTIRDMENSKPCLDAAKAFMRSMTEAEADKNYDNMIKVC